MGRNSAEVGEECIAHLRCVLDSHPKERDRHPQRDGNTLPWGRISPLSYRMGPRLLVKVRTQGWVFGRRRGSPLWLIKRDEEPAGSLHTEVPQHRGL